MKKTRFLYLLSLTPIVVSTPLFLLSCNKDSKLVSYLKNSNESYIAVIYNKESKNLDNFKDIINDDKEDQLKKSFTYAKDQFNYWWKWEKPTPSNNLKKSYFKNKFLDKKICQEIRDDLNGLSKEIENIEIKQFEVKKNIKDSKLYKETNKYLQTYFNDNFVKYFKSNSNPNDSKIIPGQSNKNRKEKIEKWINELLKEENDFFFIYVRNGRIINLKNGFSAKTSDDFDKWIKDVANEFWIKDNNKDIGELYKKWDDIYYTLENKFK